MIPFKWYPTRAPDGKTVWCMMAQGTKRNSIEQAASVSERVRRGRRGKLGFVTLVPNRGGCKVMNRKDDDTVPEVTKT